LLLALFVGLQLTRDGLHRPYEWDELITLRFFTWAGIEADGERNPLDRLEDIEGLDRPGLRHLAIGLYCALGRWPGPQNHIVNSLLSNFALALLRPSEASLRMASLAGALVFGVALFWLVYETLRWRAAAPIVLFLALWSPFVWRHSVTARGYTWMLALQILLLILLLRVSRQPSSILWASLAALLAILNFMNMVTMALYWVIPVYLVLWALGPDSEGKAGELRGADRVAWRRNLWVQVLIVGGVGLMFLIDRLPYAYSASGPAELRTGWGGGQDVTQLAQAIGHGLFPGVGWKLLAIVGVLGLIMVPRRSAQRTISVVGLMAMGVAFVHVFSAGRTPPARTLSWLIPVVLLGAAGVMEQLLERARTPQHRSMVWAAAGMASVLVVTTAPSRSLDRAGFVDFLGELKTLSSSADQDTVVLRDKRVGIIAPLYYPSEWYEAEKGPPNTGPTRLLVLVAKTYRFDWRLATRSQSPGATGWQPLEWPEVRLREISEKFRIMEISGQISQFPGDARPPRALVLWYPAFESVAVRPDRVQRFVDRYPLRYIPLQAPFQAKLEIFVKLTCLVFPVESDAEREEVDRVVTAAIEEFGGSAFLFTPEEMSSGSDPEVDSSQSTLPESEDLAAMRTKEDDITTDKEAGAF